MRIKHQLIGYTTLLVGIASIFFGALYVMYDWQFLKQRYADKGIGIARMIARNAGYGLRGRDRGILNGFIASAMEDADVESVLIADRFGRVIAASNRRQIGTILFSRLPPPAAGRGRQRQIRYFEPTVSVRMPIVSIGGSPERAGTEAGSVVVQMDLRRAIVQAVAMRNRVAAITVLFMLVVAAISNLISELIARPLTRLNRATESIARGELGERVPVQDNNELGQLSDAFNRMTDELRQSRSKLSSYTETLEREVFDRTASLRRANAELREINRELDDFTYIVSHDLKEPLRSISSFSSFLYEDYYEKIDEEGKDYLRRINAATGRMQRLIEELLFVSRINKTQRVFVEMSLRGILDDVLKRMEFVIAQTKAEIVIPEVLPKIVCDPVLLPEVFYNLVSNALKFSERDRPRVEIGCGAESDTEWTFFVRDNGPGIEERHFEKIFQIFQRLGKREAHEGTGAGLTIVKRIVEKHRGTIWVESRIGDGSTFWLSIRKPQTSGSVSAVPDSDAEAAEGVQPG